MPAPPYSLPASLQATRHPSGNGQSGDPCCLSGLGVGLSQTADQTTVGQTGGYSEGAWRMTAAGQSNQASTAFTDREAVICCKSSTCWSLVHETLDQSEHQGEEIASPHSPQSGVQGRHPLVAVIPPILEWNSLLCGHHNNNCHRPGDFHRCVQVTWLWSLLQRSMVSLPSPSPGTPQSSGRNSSLWWQQRLPGDIRGRSFSTVSDNLPIGQAWEGNSHG